MDRDGRKIGNDNDGCEEGREVLEGKSKRRRRKRRRRLGRKSGEGYMRMDILVDARKKERRVKECSVMVVGY